VTSSDYSQAAPVRRLLAAANTLRGPVDPADFKAYVFPLLVFKRISDTWGWEHERALDAFGGNEELAHPDNATLIVSRVATSRPSPRPAVSHRGSGGGGVRSRCEPRRGADAGQ
jgi:hypothetical protein